jgi:hypothetical protein
MSASADARRDVRPPAAEGAYYDEVVRLPGFRTPPNRCRALEPVGFCRDGHAQLGRSSCETRYCPDHWPGWLTGAAEKIVARLAAYREAHEGAERRMLHLVASPDQDRRWSVRDLWETRRDAYDALEAAGARGGATIVHPYRTSEEGERLYARAVEHGSVDEDRGKWSLLREAADGWEEMTRFAEPAPHYHSLAAAVDVDGSRAPDGWVVENVRSMSRFHRTDPECYRDMAAAVVYILSHAADQQGRQTTTYFGEIHPSVFDPEEELTAAAWDRIQREAANAVGADPEEGAGAGSAEEECRREECEAIVEELQYLRERLADEEWLEHLRGFADGGGRVATMRGLLAYVDGRTDRPPPSARTSKERMSNWLKRHGTRRPGQGSVPSEQTGLRQYGADI